MKPIFGFLGLLALAVLGMIALQHPNAGRAQEKARRAKWEYRVLNSMELAKAAGIKLDGGDTGEGSDVQEKALNKLGAEGWELVSVAAEKNRFLRVFYLKRGK